MNAVLGVIALVVELIVAVLILDGVVVSVLFALGVRREKRELRAREAWLATLARTRTDLDEYLPEHDPPEVERRLRAKR